MMFSYLETGESFVFHGETFKKITKSRAEDPEGYGYVFQAETLIERIGATENQTL
jgi:hypothetical protein